MDLHRWLPFRLLADVSMFEEVNTGKVVPHCQNLSSLACPVGSAPHRWVCLFECWHVKLLLAALPTTNPHSHRHQHSKSLKLTPFDFNLSLVRCQEKLAPIEERDLEKPAHLELLIPNVDGTREPRNSDTTSPISPYSPRKSHTTANTTPTSPYR
jgi:hypothetical protein